MAQTQDPELTDLESPDITSVHLHMPERACTEAGTGWRVAPSLFRTCPHDNSEQQQQSSQARLTEARKMFDRRRTTGFCRTRLAMGVTRVDPSGVRISRPGPEKSEAGFEEMLG